MSAILKSLNAHNFTIGKPILMKLESKPMVYRALSFKSYSSLGFQSPLNSTQLMPQKYVLFQKNHVIAATTRHQPAVLPYFHDVRQCKIILNGKSKIIQVNMCLTVNFLMEFLQSRKLELKSTKSFLGL